MEDEVMVKRLTKVLASPRSLALALLFRAARLIPDATYLRWMFRLRMGRPLDLECPRTFSEKLQWLKLYDRNPEYHTMVDKFAVKNHVAKLIGSQYVIPTLGVWESFEDIDFDVLPDRFVLKTTHGGGGGGVVVCRDKATFDLRTARARLNASLAFDIYRKYKEWPYKGVPRRIIAEQFVEDSTLRELRDYKFFCFNGVCRYCQVIKGRGGVMSVDFFDRQWRHQPFHEPKEYPFSDEEIGRPENLELMWSLAERLAGKRSFSRIDFYEADGRVYFGEITFYPTSGMGGFSPEEWDSRFGELVLLPDQAK